jgi:hypothetical protein
MMRGFPGAALGADARGLAAVVNRLNSGKLNCTGTVVLTPNAASTLVTDSRATAESFIGLSPLTGSAAAAAAGLYVATRDSGSFSLAHADNAEADRSFVYVIIG